jgi:hypothetical protein
MLEYLELRKKVGYGHFLSVLRIIVSFVLNSLKKF